MQKLDAQSLSDVKYLVTILPQKPLEGEIVI
jgi:hypothetical protein